jgi:hypothetical protein
MGRREPLCGNPEAHAPHGSPVPGKTFLMVCPGWCQRDADATALAERLDQAARDSLWPLALPAGMRLECHPSVVTPLRDLYVPERDEFTPHLAVVTGEDVAKPQIPVVVVPGMERGQWRITADDGPIAEGTVRDD